MAVCRYMHTCTHAHMRTSACASSSDTRCMMHGCMAAPHARARIGAYTPPHMRDAAPARQYQCINACNGSNASMHQCINASMLKGAQARNCSNANRANIQWTKCAIRYACMQASLRVRGVCNVRCPMCYVRYAMCDGRERCACRHRCYDMQCMYTHGHA